MNGLTDLRSRAIELGRALERTGGGGHMKYREIGKYLVVDPEVCFGRLTFKGTRLPVDVALQGLAHGGSIDYVLRNWPHISREAVEEAIELAAAALVKVCKARPFREDREPVASSNRRHKTRRNSRDRASK